MKNKTKYKIILVLIILATIASIILSFVPLSKACGDNGSCSIVNTSKYEKTFGIKNSHLGLIAFPILLILTMLELKKSRKYQKRLLILGLILGTIFALYFMYIQFFILKAICKYCMVVDIGVLVSMAIIFLEEEKEIIN